MAQIGITFKASVNDGASQAQAEFAEPMKFTFPKQTIGVFDYLPLNSTTRSKKKLPTFIDNGNFTGEIMFNKADYKRLTAMKGKRYVTGSTEYEWKLTTPDEDGATATLTPLTMTFKGFITDLDGPEATSEGTLMVKFTVEVNGDITEGDGTNASAYA